MVAVGSLGDAGEAPGWAEKLCASQERKVRNNCITDWGGDI